MTRAAAQTLDNRDRVLQAVEQGAIVIGASLFVALCAKITVPLTPVPLTVQNFAVILVGLMLGGRRGFAALALYLAEGASGLAVFTPGPGGIAQLLGPTGRLPDCVSVRSRPGWLAVRARQIHFLVGGRVRVSGGNPPIRFRRELALHVYSFVCHGVSRRVRRIHFCGSHQDHGGGRHCDQLAPGL